MSRFDDALGYLNLSVLDEYGDDATYAHAAGGAAYTARLCPGRLFPDMPEAQGSLDVVWTARDELSQEPAVNDTVVLGGKTYKVFTVTDDQGLGVYLGLGEQ